MSWISPKNITLQGHRISMIDLKFEDYPEKDKINLHIWMQKFSAPLGHNEYLNYADGQSIVSRFPLPGIPMLPPDWGKYAYIVYADGTTKEPGLEF